MQEKAILSLVLLEDLLAQTSQLLEKTEDAMVTMVNYHYHTFS